MVVVIVVVKEENVPTEVKDQIEDQEILMQETVRIDLNVEKEEKDRIVMTKEKHVSL